MRLENGIHVYGPDEEVPVPDGLDPDVEVVSEYGFKVVEIAGRKMWKAGTEEDYRATESIRLNIQRHEVDRSRSRDCWSPSPTQCYGHCLGGFCQWVYDPATQLRYCQCVD